MLLPLFSIICLLVFQADVLSQPTANIPPRTPHITSSTLSDLESSTARTDLP